MFILVRPALSNGQLGGDTLKQFHPYLDQPWEVCGIIESGSVVWPFRRSKMRFVLSIDLAFPVSPDGIERSKAFRSQESNVTDQPTNTCEIPDVIPSVRIPLYRGIVLTYCEP